MHKTQPTIRTYVRFASDYTQMTIGFICARVHCTSSRVFFLSSSFDHFFLLVGIGVFRFIMCIWKETEFEQERKMHSIQVYVVECAFIAYPVPGTARYECIATGQK